MSETTGAIERGRIVVVEDDPRISDVLAYALQSDGYAVEVIARGRAAISICETAPPAVLVLDVGLPDIDGFEVCRAVRKFSDVPIIFLTSRSDEINRVVGLEIGGDDYMVKPFSTRELLARIKAIQRRQTPPERKIDISAAEPLFYGPIAIDRAKFRVRFGKDDINLTAQEFRLVELFAQSPGRVFTRQQLLNRAWGDDVFVTDRTVDAHVKTLRKKFAGCDFIETIRGVGYRAKEL